MASNRLADLAECGTALSGLGAFGGLRRALSLSARSSATTTARAWTLAIDGDGR